MTPDGRVFKPLSTKIKPFSSLWLNNATFMDYYYRLLNIYINMFKWENVPDTVDIRFLELTLCEYGYAVYFRDEILGDLALTAMIGPGLNVYRVPVMRRAFAINGYSRTLSENDSVLIYNNYLRQPSVRTLLLYARRLYEIERTIDVNVKAQKHPVVIVCSEEERLTYENLYKNYDGNAPVIFGTKDLDLKNISAIKTDAPYVADKLNILKRQIWNEALTFCGVSNSNTEKKERLVTDEITSNLGGVAAQRFIMLNARREAVKKINAMFGTNISVSFNDDFSTVDMTLPEGEGEVNGEPDN